MRRPVIASFFLLALAGCGSQATPGPAGQPSPSACADSQPTAAATAAVTTYCGASIPELSASWWQWAVAAPQAANPVSDTTGGHCADRQTGAVFNLAGTTGGAATRTCSVPAGKALLFPVLNEVCGSASASCSQADFTGAKTVATLDGVALAPQTATSDAFTMTAVAGNPFVSQSGTLKAKSYGLWVLLRPLTAGPHELKFGGIQGKVNISATYHLTVG